MENNGLSTRYFLGDLQSLENLLFALKNLGLRVLSYKLEKDFPVFGEVYGLNDLPVGYSDVQNPGCYRLVKEERGFFRHTQQSPKYFLHRPIQVVYEVYGEREAIQVEDKTTPTALFGIKPCDRAAIEVFDRILERDEIYRARRLCVEYIVVEECVKPGDACFCGSLGTGPSTPGRYDVAYARLDEAVVFKVGSEKGLKIIGKIGLKEAPEEFIRRYDEVMNEAERRASKIPPLNVTTRALEALIAREEFWREVSTRCVGCASCNMVCPTCFCTEFFDYFDYDGRAKRERRWFGCLSYTYGQVAGQHFRPELFMRYRHFVLHKFVFYRKQIGLHGCVGCGRCITWCPMGVDLREAVLKAVQYAGL